MKMPVLFVGHGSPMNAIEENSFTGALRDVRKKLPTPTAVCVVSAHWVTSGCRVLDVPWPKTIHDFYGFPQRLYEVQYPAPGAVQEAKRLAMEHHLVTGARMVQADFEYRHVRLGVEMAEYAPGAVVQPPLMIVHNLHKINWEMPHAAYASAEEFDLKVKEAIDKHDVESLSAPDRWGTSLLAEAHPTLEHYAPILYCLGSTDERDRVSYPYEGMEFGTISMRMALFEAAGA